MKEPDKILKGDTPQRRYHLKNRDVLIQKHRVYNGKNKERIREYGKKWRAKNRKRVCRMNSERHIHDRIVLILELGGKCEKCGYHEIISILQVHHLKGRDTNRQFMEEFKRWKQTGELPKDVIVLCPNHHMIEHYGIYSEWGDVE